MQTNKFPQFVNRQTKAYDECTNSLSIFTKEELEFLEFYCWLRDMSVSIKPYRLFAVMSNAVARTEAEQILQVCNESVPCPDIARTDSLCEAVG